MTRGKKKNYSDEKRDIEFEIDMLKNKRKVLREKISDSTSEIRHLTVFIMNRKRKLKRSLK